jgi:hypothetical protein
VHDQLCQNWLWKETLEFQGSPKKRVNLDDQPDSRAGVVMKIEEGRGGHCGFTQGGFSPARRCSVVMDWWCFPPDEGVRGSTEIVTVCDPTSFSPRK